VICTTYPPSVYNDHSLLSSYSAAYATMQHQQHSVCSCVCMCRAVTGVLEAEAMGEGTIVWYIFVYAA